MKRMLFLSLLFSVFTLTGCQSQTKPREGGKTKTKSEQTPKGNWVVHKRYDKNGNLVGMSSYYSYASVNGKEVPPSKIDSLVHRFHWKMPRMSFGFMKGRGNLNSDSLQRPFFGRHFMGNFRVMQQRMMRRMNAMSRHFMQQMRPQPWIPRAKNVKPSNDYPPGPKHQT